MKISDISNHVNLVVRAAYAPLKDANGTGPSAAASASNEPLKKATRPRPAEPTHHPALNALFDASPKTRCVCSGTKTVADGFGPFGVAGVGGELEVAVGRDGDQRGLVVGEVGVGAQH